MNLEIKKKKIYVMGIIYCILLMRNIIVSGAHVMVVNDAFSYMFSHMPHIPIYLIIIISI